MTTGRYRRLNLSLRQAGSDRTHREENFFLVVIGFSLLAHVIVAAILGYSPSSPRIHKAPTLSVDLVMPPVANPQRGSAGAIRKIAAPVIVQKVPALTTKVAKEEVVLKGKEIKKTAEVENDDIRKYIAKMKQSKAEQDEEKDALNAIAAMRKRTTPAPQVAAPVGSASGTGNEEGSAVGEWLQQAVKEKWTWADRKRKDLSAEIEVNFASNGKIIGYRFKRSSGDVRFDKSLTDAFIKLETLPKPLGKPLQETFLFNLDDLQGL